MKLKFIVASLACSLLINIFLMNYYINNSLSEACATSASPIDDPLYTHIIEKRGNNYIIAYSYGNCGEKFLYIGNSAIGLEEYVGKRVIIQGTWAHHLEDISSFTRAKQCIGNQCHALFAAKNESTEVIDITNITLDSRK